MRIQIEDSGDVHIDKEEIRVDHMTVSNTNRGRKNTAFFFLLPATDQRLAVICRQAVVDIIKFNRILCICYCLWGRHLV